MNVRYFRTAEAFRAWLEVHHADRAELWVGFYNRTSGRGGLTYPQAVDAALCFGWIDGIRKKVDADRYTNRFTPRRPGSRWSAINVKRIAELRDAGLVAAAGVKAVEAWDGSKAPYSFEHPPAELAPDLAATFKKNRRAWAYFSSRPPGYQRLACYFVMSAKKAETRQRRLAVLIAQSLEERKLF